MVNVKLNTKFNSFYDDILNKNNEFIGGIVNG